MKGSNFKYLMEGMNGHIFQMFGETDRRTQFGKSIEILGLYKNGHLSNAEDMAPLYKEIHQPVVKKCQSGAGMNT